jgi:putative transposase
MIDRDHELPVSKQCAALGISRGSIYYEPAAVSVSDLALMHRLDEMHLEHPHAGSRMLKDLLAAEGSKVGRRHVRTLGSFPDFTGKERFASRTASRDRWESG